MKRKMTRNEAAEYLHTMRRILGVFYANQCEDLPMGAIEATDNVLQKFLSAIRTLEPDGYEPDEFDL